MSSLEHSLSHKILVVLSWVLFTIKAHCSSVNIQMEFVAHFCNLRFSECFSTSIKGEKFSCSLVVK